MHACIFLLLIGRERPVELRHRGRVDARQLPKQSAFPLCHLRHFIGGFARLDGRLNALLLLAQRLVQRLRRSALVRENILHLGLLRVGQSQGAG